MVMGLCWRSYLQVHLFETDEHPGNESLPKACRDKAHLDQTLQGVVAPLAEPVDVHGGLVGKKVGQQVATATAATTFRKQGTKCCYF